MRYLSCKYITSLELQGSGMFIEKLGQSQIDLRRSEM